MPLYVPIWSHQVTTSYLRSLIGPDDGGRPFSEIWPKTHDGLNLMSRWDHHPLAISGPESLVNLAKMHAAAGRNLRPWGVVSGLDPEAEGKLAAEMAIVAAAHNLTNDIVFIVDLEPYYHGGSTPQFWRGDLFTDGPDRARRYLDAYLSVTQGHGTIWVAGDVREAHLAAVSYDVWAAHPAVSLHTPQTYYTIFDGRPDTPIGRAKMHIDRANAILARYGVEPGRIGHILPAEGDPGVLIEAMAYCRSLGQQKPSIWQRVNIPAATCDALLAADDPWPKAPAPEPGRPKVGRETRLVPAGPWRIEGEAEPVFQWTDTDDIRGVEVTLPVQLRGRMQIVRDR